MGLWIVPALVLSWLFWMFLSNLGLLHMSRRHKPQEAPILDRKARFALYVRGEQQLMADWECSFSPVVCHREREAYREQQVIQDRARACRQQQNKAQGDPRVSHAEFSVILQRCSAMERATWNLPKLAPSIYVLPNQEDAA